MRTDHGELRPQIRLGVHSGHDAVAGALEHVQGAAREIAVLVGQLGLVAGLKTLLGHRPVLTEGDLAKEVVPQRVAP